MRNKILLPAMVLVGVISGLLMVPNLVMAGHSASSLTLLTIREDTFWNYDFVNPGVVASDNVDWPVTMLFWNNADTIYVKANYWPIGGAFMYLLLNDGQGDYWSSDRGTKSNLCLDVGDVYHMRVYANQDFRSYNLDWSFYILGTTHIDHNECGTGKWSGESELAEDEFARLAKQKWGVNAVAEDWASFFNFEQWRQRGSHIVHNNGFATAVRIP